LHDLDVLLDDILADAFKVMVNSCNTKKAVVDQLKEQLVSKNKDTISRLQQIDSNCSKISVTILSCSSVYDVCMSCFSLYDFHAVFVLMCKFSHYEVYNELQHTTIWLLILSNIFKTGSYAG
jgi:hypothetical protein